ncbi:lytic murein transglycosylase [Arsenophonus sp. ENCA]|uniref:transglycosylase SLT domain-containing protein n=1 Tax=Arsenophonus sp. ENCA TaxID=1987579 RepID=UPI000BCF2E89|nr:transglycosylase SLT domain-containing protein [Arsenophonus sp. ENCA]PAV01284.1 lytic murein transglycosylase [Arsenophonus sp. ENCA]
MMNNHQHPDNPPGMMLFFLLMLLLGGAFDANAAHPPPAALPYRADLIRNARLVWGLNAPVADFAAQIEHESGWQPGITNHIGAQGLGQFMPATTAWIGELMPALAAKAPLNPSWSLRAVVSFDYWLWQRLSAVNRCERMAMTLSAYNGGLGWVQRDRRLAERQGVDGQRWFDSVERVNAGRSMSAWRENRHYPRRILYTLAPRYLTWGGASCV